MKKYLQLLLTKHYFQNGAVFFLYLICFAVVLDPMRNGIGLFWDWSIPYYSDTFKNLFYFKYLSWNETNFGSPLGYSSDYYLRFVMAYLPFQPEINVYLIILLSFTTTSFLSYVTFLQKNKLVSFILGLVVILNPLVFYKVMAGHYLHIVSYAIFAYLVYFMFHIFKAKWNQYLLLGLLLAFIGFQIQFFVFSAIFLTIYFFGHRKYISIPKLFVMGAIILCINLVWLINFLTGANNVVEVSNLAKTVSFVDSQSSHLINILFLSFSTATQIKTIFPSTILLTFVGMYIILLGLLLTRKIEFTGKILFANILVFLILSTGIYNNFQIPVIKYFYPMIREVGHFGVLIIFFSILLIKQLLEKCSKGIIFLILLFFIYFSSINSYFFRTELPVLNFTKIRETFHPYQQFLKQTQTDNRILTYPFFNQYGFLDKKTNIKNEKLMSNAGQDNFTIFSGTPYVNNAVAPSGFQDSIQFRFVKSGYNTDLLLPYNIKYLFDFSHIYESNIQKYVPASAYEDNIKYIKNDPTFLANVIAKNPGKVRLVAPHILEIMTVQDRITATTPFTYKKIDPTKYILHFPTLKKGDELVFRETYHPKWALQGIKATHEKTLIYAQKWTIMENKHDIDLVLYFEPETPFISSLFLSLGTLVLCLGALIYSSLYIDK